MATADAIITMAVKDQTKRGLSSITSRLGRFAGPAGIAAGAIAGVGTAAVGIVTKIANAGDEFQKMGLRTGISTEYLSQMQYALQQSGTSLETFENGIKRQSSFLEDARNGLSTSVDALTSLGLSYEELAALSPEEQFHVLADAIGSIEDPTRRSALAQDVFGRAGTALLPIIQEGSTGMAALRAEADSLGKTFSQDAANSSAQFNDNLNTLKTSVGSLVQKVGIQLLPIFVQVTDFLIQQGIPAMQSLFNVIGNILTPAITILKTTLQPLIESILPPLRTLFQGLSTDGEESAGILTQVKEVVNALKPVFTALGTVVGTVLGTLVTNFTTVLSTVSQVLGAFITLFKGDWRGFLEGIVGAARTYLSGLVNLFTAPWTIVKRVFAQFGIDLDHIMIHNVVNPMISAFENIANFGIKSFNWLTGGIENSINGIISLIDGWTGGVNRILGVFGRSIPQIGKISLQGIKVQEVAFKRLESNADRLARATARNALDNPGQSALTDSLDSQGGTNAVNPNLINPNLIDPNSTQIDFSQNVIPGTPALDISSYIGDAVTKIGDAVGDALTGSHITVQIGDEQFDGYITRVANQGHATGAIA